MIQLNYVLASDTTGAVVILFFILPIILIASVIMSYWLCNKLNQKVKNKAIYLLIVPFSALFIGLGLLVIWLEKYLTR